MADRWTTRRRGYEGRAAGLLGKAVPCLLLCLLAGGVAIAQPASPEILRGSAAPPPTVVEPAAGPPGQTVAAGERLWIVDEKAGTITGCRIVNTIRVGVEAIDCTTRHLPASLRGRR